MNEPRHGIILVYSTSHALKAESILKRAGIACKLIPVPRQISSDCGSCVRVAREDLAQALQLVESAGVGVAGTHVL